MNTKRSLGRREFLKTAAQATATAAVFGSMAPPVLLAETPAQSLAAIPTRTLGQTGLKLPILGYGGAALPKAWLNPLSHEDRVELVRYAYERGIRYFDLAAMLLPVLSAAKARAQGIKCVNNVKQLHLAWQLYTDDHDSQLVRANQWCFGQFTVERDYIKFLIGGGGHQGKTCMNLLIHDWKDHQGRSPSTL